MRKIEKLGPPDMLILTTVMVLVVAGVLLVFDASYAKTGDAKWANYDIYYMAKRQLIYAVFGLGCMFIASRMRLQTFLKITTPLLIFAIIALLLVMVPDVGTVVNGARRWIRFGPISIQPSEIAKIALVLYLAAVLARRKMLVRRVDKNWFGVGGVIGLITLLVVIEPDLGTAIAFVATCFVMLYAAGAMKRHLIMLAASGAGLAVIAILAEPYRMDRIRVWLDPWKDRYNEGYQVIHSLIALGTGGIWGVGLCEGREKLYLPAASTDFVMATLLEEAGLIGGALLLGLFLLLTYKGLDVARRSQSTYATLIAVGMTSMISMQALINVAVVSASIPATGVPMPFISYGGSSLVASLIAVGVLLSVSAQTKVTLEEKDLYESSFNRWRDRRSHISSSKRRSGSSRTRTVRRAAVRR